MMPAVDFAVWKWCGCIRISDLMVGANVLSIIEVAKRVPIVQAASKAGIVIGSGALKQNQAAMGCRLMRCT